MKFLTVIFIFLLYGCTNKYDLCIEQQKKDYREHNPKASYGQVQSKQFEFELMCSKYKSK
jgi:hypothetical protein